MGAPDRPRRILLLITARTYRGEAFLQAAQRLGIEVVPVVDMADGLAQRWRYPLGVDFGQPQQAVARVVAYAREAPVDAVLAVDDSGTQLAAEIAAALGLPHNSPLAAAAAADKHRMRSLMAAAGVPCPRFRLAWTGEDPQALAGEVDYPCVVKPLNLNGSRGVIRADDAAQFVAAVQRLAQVLHAQVLHARVLHAQQPAASHPYLVEDYIPGGEVALEGLLDRGELAVLALFDKPDPLEGPFFEETIYVTPSRLPPETQTAITRCVAQAARALGLQTGPVHAELRVNQAGPWLLEVAGRSIGGLCARTLRFGVGDSLEELILRQAVGMQLPSTAREQRASGVMMIPIPEAGILKRVQGMDAASAVPGIEGVEITAKVDYPLVPLPEGDSYLGFIFARADTPAQVEDALRAAHACLHIAVMPELALHTL